MEQSIEADRLRVSQPLQKRGKACATLAAA